MIYLTQEQADYVKTKLAAGMRIWNPMLVSREEFIKAQNDHIQAWVMTLSEQLKDVKVGDRIKFKEEVQAYTVQARSANFLVLNKPFNARKTTLYTIIDIKEKVRGPENLIFGAGALTRQDCEEMIERLEGRAGNELNGWVHTEVSYRNRIPVVIEKIIQQKRSQSR